jgi:peroxiredoxin
VFGVSFDSREENAVFAEAQQFPFRLLCDVKRELGLAYKTCARADDLYAKRHTYVIGPDGKIERAIATKDAAGQAAELLALL